MVTRSSIIGNDLWTKNLLSSHSVQDVIKFVKQIFMEAILLRLLLNKLHSSLELKLVDT